MGVKTSDENAIDYTDDFAQMIAVGEQIRDELTLIREALYAGEQADGNSLATSQHAIAQAIEQIRQRASQEQLGIFTRPITKGDGGLSRAAMINALKQSDQLDNVRQEMAAPTPL
ncbi:hypothetical protein E0L35_10245 [Halomonas sp. ATBC28]|uniref:hypothetical protein n=1 Tax=Halomonas sp. ATBC28 TaxID=2545264 RepID=UPI00110D4668|nr:hypothetical protein [Halomonas sp. ATBC28]TMU24610.1 hypothetical protein E0L35_10245 [Halomonas sp. ATBC28]